MLFTVAVLFVLSLWVPPVPSESPENRTPRPWITPQVAVILGVSAAVAALALPASMGIRLLVGLVLLGTTLAALALETPIRRWLGGLWWP